MSESKYESKYLDEKDLSSLSIRNISSFEVVSNDTINEKKLLESIENTGKIEELFAATIQMAICGYGNKNFISYKYKGEVRNLRTLFNGCGIAADNNQAIVLDESALTPRRLLRLFRYQIRDYIRRTNTPSYLFYKYNKSNPEMMSICFPGGEHLVETDEEVSYIYETYKKIDEALKLQGKQHGISDRVTRVLLARGKLIVENV